MQLVLDEMFRIAAIHFQLDCQWHFKTHQDTLLPVLINVHRHLISQSHQSNPSGFCLASFFSSPDLFMFFQLCGLKVRLKSNYHVIVKSLLSDCLHVWFRHWKFICPEFSLKYVRYQL